MDTSKTNRSECAKITVGSLFAGIGGFDLGFERAGFDVIWQCEKDDYCQRVLNKHWPDTPVYDDVQTLYTYDGPSPTRPDVLIGGFPCQDISLAGKGAGLEGERSSLWWEFARIIRLVRPRYAVLENVRALVNRGLPAILGWLARHGYDAEWQIVSAAALDAPHLRERVFIVAHRRGKRRAAWRPNHRSNDRHESATKYRLEMADTNSGRQSRDKEAQTRRDKIRPPAKRQSHIDRCCVFERSSAKRGEWAAEPNVGRVADGVPSRVDRLKGLGNAIVPQVAEYVAACVRDHASRTHRSADPTKKRGYT